MKKNSSFLSIISYPLFMIFIGFWYLLYMLPFFLIVILIKALDLIPVSNFVSLLLFLLLGGLMYFWSKFLSKYNPF